MKQRIIIYKVCIILGIFLAFLSGPDRLIATELPPGTLDFPVLVVSNDPVKLRLFLISTSCPDYIDTSIRASRVHSHMASPACHPCYPGSPSIGYGSFR